MPAVSDIIRTIEEYAPAQLQESWDNTGLQIGHRNMDVTGVLAVLDVTPARIDEAVANGLNMIVSHHPLIFKGIKSVTDDNQVQRSVEMAIRNNIAVYSSHTAMDNAVNGVSALMAERLDADVIAPLVPSSPDAQTGTGVIARLRNPLTENELIIRAKDAFGTKTVRCNRASRPVRTVALCGGSGGSFILDAIRANADAYITGDIRYHDFVDNPSDIVLIDCGHYETEVLTRNLFKKIINSRYPDLRVLVSPNEKNPVSYI